MDPVIWSTLLLVVGLVLAVGEVFIPSVGVLGFLSMASMLAAIGLAFYTRGIGVGLVFLALTAVAGPSTLVLALRIWPKTAMGRRLLLDVPRGDDVLPDSPLRHAARLGGQGGNGQHADASQRRHFDRGAFGRCRERGTAHRAGNPDPRDRYSWQPGAGAAGAPDEPETPTEMDVLSQPIESLGLDPFDEPLA